ncbi:MAG: recombination-associated protein RdgC [Betaproteobacteria bacterium]|nr:recombination-associated protein RdgC [Betaproteobacteria bacterium]
MWFRNLQIYRLTDAWRLDAAQLQEKLVRHVFRSCSPGDMQARGWVPPRGQADELVLASQKQLLICLGVEQKLLPASVIRQYAQDRLLALEANQGFKPGRKQVQEVRESVTAELLPRAFVKRRLSYAWIDPLSGWLVVDAASQAKADEFIEQIKLSLGELPLKLLRTRLAPATAMTDWLAAGEAPAGFTIDRDCELRASGGERATVRYARHTLEAAEIGQHIAGGKAATRLALTWQERVSLVLTEELQVKRLAFLDILKEEVGRQTDNPEELFEADFVLMSGELARLLGQLTAALGGEAE